MIRLISWLFSFYYLLALQVSYAALNGLTPFEIDASSCDFDTTLPINCQIAQHGASASGFDWEDPYAAGTTTDNLGRVIKYTGIQNTVVRVDDGGNGGCGNWYYDSTNPGDDQNAFSGGAGASNNPWSTPVITDPNNKTDFCIYYTANEVIEIPDPVAGAQFHNILYQGFAVNLDGSGTVQTLIPLFVDIFNTRSVGDRALILDVNPSNLASSQITIGEWSGSGWNGSAVTLPSDQLDCSISSDGRMFAECAIDLTAIGAIPDDECSVVSLSGALSLTGGSFNSQLKDFVSIPANADGSSPAIVNCGQLKVTKELAVNASETFNYSTQQIDGETLRDATLADIDGDTIVDTDQNPGDFSNITETLTAPAPDSMDQWSGIINSPDYTLSEPLPLADDWALVDMECTYYDPFQPGFVTSLLTINDPAIVPPLIENTGSQFIVWPDDITVNPDGTINVIEDHTASCTITNTFTGVDFGDAPDTYSTLTASNGASHLATGSIYIGATPPDTDDDGQPNVDADGDDADVDGDDEDGPVFVTQYIVTGGMVCTGSNGSYTTLENEYCVVVSATNSSAADAQLVGWLDYNINGVFDINERSVAITDPAVDDGTFTTGNVTANSGTNNYVLVFTGLGNDNHVTQAPPFQRADETYARIRITSDPLSGFFSDSSPEPTGAVQDGEVEDEKVAFDTLPVTISAVSSERQAGKVKFDWSTSSELFNVGFQLWGLDGSDDEWDKLHTWLVRSGSGNSVEQQSYTKTVNVPASISDLIALGISSVDSDGSEHYYGPFEVGMTYGNLANLKPIAWNHIRSQADEQMAARGYIKDRIYGYRKLTIENTDDSATPPAADANSFAEFTVKESGIYRITAEELLQAGMDLTQVARQEIALVDYYGNPVVRYISARGTGTGQSKTLGASGEIFFHATQIDPTAGLYSRSKFYRLVLNQFLALDAQSQAKQGVSSGFSTHYMETLRIEKDSYYSLASTADDPWLDAVVLSYSDQPRSYAVAMPVEEDAIWSQASFLTMSLNRSSGLNPVDSNADGQADMEHYLDAIVLSPQAQDGILTVGTTQALGAGEWNLEFEVPANTPLTFYEGQVVVGGIFSAGEGYAFSEVHVDSVSLSYARPYTAKSSEAYLSFTVPQNQESGYEISIPDTGWPWVFAYNSQGVLVRLALESQSQTTATDGSRQRLITVATLNGLNSAEGEIKYWASGRSGFLNVESLITKSVMASSILLAQAADSEFLVIAHPAFIGTDTYGIDHLSKFTDAKRAQGYNISIINYLDIVETFGGGQPGPHGLSNYLAQVESQRELEYVLLVGGSSYDHNDNLGTGAVTFIPGYYGQSSHSKFTVTDVPYVMNTDAKLFATIGRWPVRSKEDLQTIVDKSIAWNVTNHHDGDVLLIAENTLVGENIDFAAALDDISQELPGSLGKIKIYVDEIMADDPTLSLAEALNQAKVQIVDQLNEVPQLVIYNGHGTTSQLSNNGLLKSSDLSQVAQQGAEIWLPLSCYVTYYESTHMNTLAQQLMFSANAVNISGATLLSNQGSNIAAGKAILNNTLNINQTIGEAVNTLKDSKNDSRFNINWALLGDPSTKF